MSGIPGARFRTSTVVLVTLLLIGCVSVPEPQRGGTPDTEPSPRETGEAPGAGRPEGPEDSASPRPRQQSSLDSVLATLGDDRVPVSTDSAAKEPVVARVDVTGDGVEEICLFTRSGGDEARTLEELSDLSRLSTGEEQSARFFVNIFDVSTTTPTEVVEVAAGASAVLRDVGVTRLHDSRSLPVAFYFDFASATGQELVWIVHGGEERVSRLVLQTDAVVDVSVSDLDNDGLLDIVRSERHLEDGTGYETFLTWLRWNGSRYEEYRSTNIVRNLNDFLLEASSNLATGEFDRFADESLPADLRPQVAGGSISRREVFDRLFAPSATTLQPFSELVPPDAAIEAAEFPRFYENPFASPGSRVIVPVRIRCCGGASAVFEARISLAENPFESPQFVFEPLGS